MPDHNDESPETQPAEQPPSRRDNGDYVGGDRITMGNANNSTVALGRGASVRVQHGESSDTLQLFMQIMVRLDKLENANAQDIADAKTVVAEIQEQVIQSDSVDESWLATRLRNVARMGPDILDVVTAALANPAAGIAAVVCRVAEKAREDNGLAPQN